MPRPKGLSLTAVLMTLCNVMWWIIINPNAPPYSFRTLIVYTVFAGIGFWVIWFYWQGRNWARMAVLLYSGLSILNLTTWNRIAHAHVLRTSPTHMFVLTRALLGAIL